MLFIIKTRKDFKMDLNEILFNRFKKQDYRLAVRVGSDRFWDENTKLYNSIYYVEINLQDIKNIALIAIFNILDLKENDTINFSSCGDSLKQDFTLQKTIENDIVLNDDINKILNNLENYFKGDKNA